MFWHGRRKMRDSKDQGSFDFAVKERKTKKNELECHNDLCKAKKNCNKYDGPPPDGEIKTPYRIKRESCRLYEQNK